jgi:hypothetical protein
MVPIKAYPTIALKAQSNLRIACKAVHVAQGCGSVSGSGLDPDSVGSVDPDPGYLSRILIFTHPGSRISDPKTAMKYRCEKKICCNTFIFGVINFTKLNYFIFEMLKKKIWANFQRIIKLFTQKIATKLSKIWVWDRGYPGSGKTPSRIPDLGSRGQKGTGSRIRIPNTGSRRAKMTHKSRKKMLKVHVLKCWMA